MSGRGLKAITHLKSGRPVTDEEIYHLIMVYRNQTKNINAIASQFDLSYTNTKELIVRSRAGGTCG